MKYKQFKIGDIYKFENVNSKIRVVKISDYP